MRRAGHVGRSQSKYAWLENPLALTSTTTVTGAAYGAWNDRVKSGMANYIAGYHPLFMLLKAMKRMGEKPISWAAAGFCLAFVKDM